MSRLNHAIAPVVSVTLALALLAGCGTSPNHVAPAASITSQSVKAEAATRKLTRAQAEVKAKNLVSDFNTHQWRSINARTEAVKKIADTDADAAYDFMLQEIADLQELRGEMKNITRDEAETYEEMLTEELDGMTPDQEQVKQRVAKAESLHMDLDELTIVEEKQNPASTINTTEGGVTAMWGGQAHVGSRNRILTAIQESKLYKACARAYKNTRKKVKHFLHNLCAKLRWC